MALNLIRNTKVYLCTNVNANGETLSGSGVAEQFNSNNLFRVDVLDGLSFTQNTESTEITINEAGVSAVRGTRQFNTQINPVDWSFTTYLRPNVSSNVVNPSERYLWNAMFGRYALDAGSSVGITSLTRANPTAAVCSITASAALTPSRRRPGTDTSVTATALEVGDVINIQGVTAAGWNLPARIIAVSSTPANSYAIEFFKQPASALGNSPAALALTNARVYTGQWGPSISALAGTTNYSYASTVGSNFNQMQKMSILFAVDNVVYSIEDAVINQASIDFGIDQIAAVTWSGNGKTIKKLTNAAQSVSALSAIGVAPNTGAAYITNRLSTVKLYKKMDGEFQGGTQYTVPITGGNITINNNVTFITPADMSRLNTAVAYFSGARSITGSLSAYLKTGTTNEMEQLFTDLSTSTDIEPKYSLVVELGGRTNTNRVELDMPGCMLQVPTIETADVVSTTFNFKAQAWQPGDLGTAGNDNYDIERTNELMIRYFAA